MPDDPKQMRMGAATIVSTARLVNLLANLLEAKDIAVIDVKTNALLVNAGGQNYMIGVQECP
jgi:hypothetical protein